MALVAEPADSGVGTGGSDPLLRLSGALPVLGHLLEFGKGPIGLLTRARGEKGDICSFRLLNREFVFMSGLEGNEALFRAEEDALSFREPYKLTVPIFGKGVVYDAHPAQMSEQLGFLMNSLRDTRMRLYPELVAEEVEAFISGWGDEGELELPEMTKELTTYTSSRCLLGREFRERMSGEFAQVYHDLEAGLIPIAFLYPFLPLPAFRRRDRARIRMVEMITEIVRYRKANNIEGQDLLQTLMDASYRDGRKLTADEMTGLVLAAIFAGHHTSAMLSAWTLIELLRNPQYLPPVIEELDQVYDGDGGVSYLSLRFVPRLERAIMEAGRLTPPLVLLMRKLVRDLAFRAHRLSAGSYLVASPYVSHRIPELFPDPERFDPDRFGPGRDEDKQPYALLTFGAGKHRCLGQHFAMMQVKVIWSLLFRHYEFEPMEDRYEPDFHRMVVGPKRPCRVRYRRRKGRRS
jgi:sterol 14alpha-demethylase